ncbi:hypothetical protein ACHAXT_006037 [Thalassiosira profunda]
MPPAAFPLAALCLAHGPGIARGFNLPASPPVLRASPQLGRCMRRRRGWDGHYLTPCSLQSLDDDINTAEPVVLNGDVPLGGIADAESDLNGESSPPDDGGPHAAINGDATIEDTNLIGASSSVSGADKRATQRKNPRMEVFRKLSEPIVEVRVIGLVLLSCFLQAINTLDDLPAGIHDGIDAIDAVCVYVFAVEFFLRWWSAGRFQLRYLARPLAALDALVVILPLFLSGILPLYEYGTMSGFLPYVDIPGWLVTSSTSSALLNLRLLRVLKFQRVLTDQKTYADFEMAIGMRKRTSDVRPYQLNLARVIISIFTLVSVSTGLIYTAEHETNPQIPDYFTALYFGLTTLTTVGFGDITPVTFEGRMVVGASILAGVAIIPAQAASLAESFLDFQKERELQKKPKAKRKAPLGRGKCDACGAGPHRKDAFFCWSCGKQLD